MSNTPIQLSFGSEQTLLIRPLQPITDPSASKRVCFYKSGDYKFCGHRMVINTRTFKTFDALLDALSKKVPLPFGVRTITTPRGTHLVKGLDDLHDGGAYICSDQKRVKPLNLDEVKRRQVPWNTTRPLSGGRRRHQGFLFGRRNDVNNRPAKVTERVAIRTPKRLVVIKNRDPTIKRTIVLQRRTAPTFDALLDYLSQILEFPVLKLYSIDGRRVDGLAALILCSGVVVAAGNEPFRLGNNSFHRTGQVAQVMHVETLEQSILLPTAQNNKSFSSGRGSRNFSSSSERYIVNQINRSRNGSTNSHLNHHDGSPDTQVNQHQTSVETCGTEHHNNEHNDCILPQDDDIEKSFRVNQDGSMTVEMKVRLTIKEEEMLHWTTTLSRTSLFTRTLCASFSESGNSSPVSNNVIAKDSSSVSQNETKEDNYLTGDERCVGFNDDQVYDSYTSTPLEKARTGFKRPPTPGPRHINKKTSVESVKMVTESGVQESTMGHYSYIERTADGETTEGYCVVRHSSSSSRPIPKPRRTTSAEGGKKGSHSSIKSSGVAEVLQIQNNGTDVTETVMHICESQGCYDNYFANEEYSVDSAPLHGSTVASDSQPSTGLHSSSNDCDIDFSCQPPIADSLQRQKEEMLSLSSEPLSPAHENMNNLSSLSENDGITATHSQTEETVKRDKTPKREKSKKKVKNATYHRGSTSTSSSDKKLKESTISPSKNSKHPSNDKLSNNPSVGKQSLSSSESAKRSEKGKGAEKKAEKSESKKSIKDETTLRKDSALLVSTENMKKTQPKRQSMNSVTAKDNGHNVNTPTGRPQMKKNMSDILQPKKSLLPLRKTASKPKTVSDNRTSLSKRSSEITESVSMPSLNPTPSEIHQYVENWLEKVPYTEANPDKSELPSKVVFQIGGDSESDETKIDEKPPSSDAIKKSASCLSVPRHHEGPDKLLLCSEQKTLGLCASMPCVRVDPVHQENKLRAHKSAEAIGPAESDSTPSNNLSPKAKLKPVLRQLCSSIQCIRRASNTNTTSNLEKSSSLPDFSTQVASVFGSPCKAFLSFLSVMTLKESLTGSTQGDNNQSRSTSEALLMMESLQKISVIEDEEEQRASLTDLQNRASSQFRERWRDFQILRERLESEPLSPRVSETEFALDVFSEGGDVFEDQHLDIDELMDELNMPQDLRAEISSTIQQTRSFYPMDESTVVETDRNQSDTEEDVEKFVEESNNETIQSTGPDSTCIVGDIPEKNQSNDGGDVDTLNQIQSMYSEQETMIKDSHQEFEAQETDLDVKESEVSQTEMFEPLEVKENDVEENGDGYQVMEDREEEKDGKTTEIHNDDEESVSIEKDREEETEEEGAKENDMGQDDWEAEKIIVADSDEKVEEEMTADEEEEERLEEVAEGIEKGMIDEDIEEAGEDNIFEETDERDAVEETEEEEKGQDEVEDEADEEEKEEEGGNEEVQVEEIEEVNEVVEETGEKEEEVVSEDNVQEEMEEVDKETGEEEEEENIIDEEEEKEEEEAFTEKDGEEDVEEAIKETDEEDETVRIEENVEEEDEMGVVTERDEEEAGKVFEETDEVEEEENITEDEDKEVEEVIEERDEDEGRAEGISEENEEEEHDVEVESTKERRDRVITDDEDERETGKDTEEEEKWDEDSRKEDEEIENSLDEGSLEEIDKLEVEENMKTPEEDREDDEDELNDQVEKQEKQDEVEEENVSEDADYFADNKECKNLLEEAAYLAQHSSSCEEINAECNSESPTKYSSEAQCEDDKGNGTDTVNDLETDEGGDDSISHPVEISQELLDFVNSALQSSSLIFTYDARGNIRIEPYNVRVVQSKHTVILKNEEDNSYGLKCLPSPSTSDISDYRPETSESGGYQSQESVDIVTESGEEASERPFPVYRRTTDIPERGMSVERAKSKGSITSNSEVLQSSNKSTMSFSSSYDSAAKASREDLSYFSAESSLKADTEVAKEAAQCISFTPEKDISDGVLIDQGRWLLKENHLIRKSPPVSLGMYGNVDSTSIDTGPDNTSVDTPPHFKTQQNPLVALSSSELEEMAKPQSQNCTYYSMPHGSDSDPFLDDSSIQSGKKDASSVKGRGVRVSPTVDTSKTWPNKNGSLSSFASVEFKMTDRKVHPEGESSAVTQATRTSSGGGAVLQAQDSLEALHLRCGQYCPIL